MEGIFMLTPNEVTYGIVNDQIIYTFHDTKKALTGDKVLYENNKVIKILKRCNNKILGVLCLNSNVIYGFTKRKVSYRKFIPLDSKLPPFIVSTKRKQQSTNVYGIIKFKEWNKSKYPIGLLSNIIGNIGDYNTEIEYLKYRNKIKWSKYNKFDITDYTNNDPYLDTRLDLTNLDIISIDPLGCKDIDDALHFREIDNNIIEIGIHIADVASYIPVNSHIDNIIKTRCESIYFTDYQINMLPDIFATNICSLLKNKKRRTSSVIIKLNKNEILDVKFVKGLIINKRNLTYEQANDIIKTKTNTNANNMIKNLYNTSLQLSKSSDNNYDSHKMVETYMILANTLVAEHFNKKFDKAIYRSHKGDKIINYSNTCLDEAIKFANILNMNSAKYTLNSYGHSALDKKYYTHFTSPIRRYIDILVHRLLYDDFKLDLDVNDINKMHKNIKKAEREENRLNIIYNIYHDNESILETYGYVINIKNDQIISIYIPELKIEAPCKLYSNKVEHVIDKNNIKKINILEKVNIKIIISLKAIKFKNKIIVQLL